MPYGMNRGVDNGNTRPNIIVKNMQSLQDLLKEVDAILDSADTPEPTDAIATATDRLLAGLQTHFGYTSFRKGQREIIEAILDGENVFAVFPTGHGKSLCYQLACIDT